MTPARPDIETLVFAAIDELLDSLDSDFDDELSGERMLVADIGFSSIDFVQMIVAIEEKLGCKVGFQDMLMQGGKYVEDLSIGQVVDFIVERLANPAPPPAAVAVEPAMVPVTPTDSTRPVITEQDVQAFAALVKPRRFTTGVAQGTKLGRAVFVLSPPRSGSTLLRVMMAGNPALFAPPELHLLSYATMDERRADLDIERGEQLLEGATRALMQTRGWSAEQARALIADCEAQAMSTHEFYRILQDGLGGRLLVDKTPTYAFSVNILRQAEAYFEDPVYIHLIRHPCGMIRSYEESDLTRMMPLMMKGSDYSTAALAEMIWLMSNRNILEFSRTVPSSRWLSMSYENIVNDPQREMIRLCAALGVPYHEDMINPYGDNKSRMTDGVDSKHKMSGDLKFHLHRQIDPAAATRWKQFCSEDMLGAGTGELVSSMDADVARIRV